MRQNTLSAGVCATLLSAGSASAITINDTFGAEGAAALGAPFLNVARLDLSDGSGPLCTGSLISTLAILTARHCTVGFAPEEITVAFTTGTGEVLFTREVSAIASLPGPEDLAPGSFDGNDISVLSLWDAVTDFPPFRLLANPMVGEIARMVGFGDQGLGSIGSVFAYDGSRWAAENVVDAIVPFAPDTMIFTDFDDPEGLFNFVAADFVEDPDVAAGLVSSPEMLPAEGTTAPGDSGGPLLFWRDGEWVIGGVLSGGTGELSAYGDLSFWNGLGAPETRALLDGFGAVYVADPAVIPLPASGWLLLAGVAGLAIRRRAA
jgi:hypothetical protein